MVAFRSGPRPSGKKARQETEKSKKKIIKGRKILKKDQGDILGERFDKKFMKLAESKEAQLQAKDFDAGVNRAEDRAMKETMQEAGIPMMAKGGRAMYKSGMRVCKLAKKGKGRAYGKNS
jgi:hypothetical protein